MQCDKCYVEMHLCHNSKQYECNCGRRIKVRPTHEAENAPQSIFVSGEIPQESHKYKSATRRKNRTIVGTTRESYLERAKVTEEDLLIEESGKEYWLRTNEEGDEIRVYLPTRFKNKNATYL